MLGTVRPLCVRRSLYARVVVVVASSIAAVCLSTPAAADGLSGARAPQGNWVGTYGDSGYDLAAWNGGSDVVSMPVASVSLVQGSRYLWGSNKTDMRELESADRSTRVAATYYDANEIQVQLRFSSAYTGNLELYALDADYAGRRETITVAGQPAYLSSDFSQGAWVILPINVSAGGSITITVDRTAGPNAVLSGIFLGGGTLPGPTITTSSPFGSTLTTCCSDTGWPYYAPFAPSNTRVISTSDGIFASYFAHWSGVDGGASDTGNVVVVRSTDGGSTWSVLLSVTDVEGRHASGALAVDSSGNVYALIESIGWGGTGTPDGRIYMFPKSTGFANDGTDYLTLSQFATGANKFTMAYDSYSNELWASGQYFAATVTTSCNDQIGTNGTAACSSGTTDSSSVWQWHHYCNDSACQSNTIGIDVQYPLIYAARDSTDAHVIVWAWTENPEANGDPNGIFYDMRFIFSTNDGATWYGTGGSTICNSGCTYGWNFDSGETGPGILINPTAETSATDGPWLDSVWVQDGYFMFMYSLCARDICRPAEAAEYARFRYSGGSTSVANTITAPTCLSTETYCPTDATGGGFFSGSGANNAPIYYTTQQSNGACTATSIEALVSTDSGASWRDHAQSAAGNWNCPYGVSGGSTLTAHGQIAGVFVDFIGGGGTGNTHTLYFFRTS